MTDLLNQHVIKLCLFESFKNYLSPDIFENTIIEKYFILMFFLREIVSNETLKTRIEKIISKPKFQPQIKNKGKLKIKLAIIWNNIISSNIMINDEYYIWKVTCEAFLRRAPKTIFIFIIFDSDWKIVFLI